MAAVECSKKRIFMGRIPHGDDLLASLTDFVRQKGIKKGKLQMIGAVQRAVVGFYNSQEEKYVNTELDRPLEVLSLIGNVSLKDGQPFIHAHITLGDEKGECYGGHLMDGTIVFASEFIVEEFEGEDLVREYDKTTGLTLWNI